MNHAHPDDITALELLAIELELNRSRSVAENTNGANMAPPRGDSSGTLGDRTSWRDLSLDQEAIRFHTAGSSSVAQNESAARRLFSPASGRMERATDAISETCSGTAPL